MFGRLENKIPVTCIPAKYQDEVFSDVMIINLQTVPHFLYVSIPDRLHLNTNLFEIECTDNSDYTIDVSLLHECKNIKYPWIRIPSSMMNLEDGQHTYKLSFINILTDDVFSLYISYIIQNDNPDKPYIYMNRDKYNSREESEYICPCCKLY